METLPDSGVHGIIAKAACSANNPASRALFARGLITHPDGQKIQEEAVESISHRPSSKQTAPKDTSH